MYLLDSNVLREYLRSNATLQAHLEGVPREELALPSAVAAEALRGRCEYALKAEPAQAVTAHALLLETLHTVVSFHLITFDQASAAKLAEIVAPPSKPQTLRRYADCRAGAGRQARAGDAQSETLRGFAALSPIAKLAG
jgi:predicted nucleic acid-binding protein